MGTRGALNILLLLLVVGLAGLVYFEPGLEQEKEVLLTSLNAAEISQIEIERPGQETIVLHRQGERWNLQQPIFISANRFRVQQVLEFLSVLSLQRYPVSGLDLSKYGLDAPLAKLIVAGTEIAFGKLDSLNQRRYVLVGDTMHLIGQNVLSLLVGPWVAYVSPSLFPADAELDSLTIPGLGVLQHDVSGWKYQGETLPQSADALQKLVDEWRNARAMEIKESDVAVEGELAVLHFANDYPELSFGVSEGEEGLVLTRQDNGLAYYFHGSYIERLLHWSAQKEMTDKVLQREL